MHLRSILAALALAFALTGCAGVDVQTDWDRAVDFDAYQTYRWAETRVAAENRENTRPRVGDPSLLDRRIRRAVDETLALKGFERRDGGSTDLLLVYHMSSRQLVDVYTSPYRRRWHGGPDVYRRREGTLLLEVVDLAENAVVWQGWGTSDLGEREDSEEKVRKVVAKVLERFPPVSE